MTDQTTEKQARERPASQERDMRRAALIAVVTALVLGLVWAAFAMIYRGYLITAERAAAQEDIDKTTAFLTSRVNRRQAQLIGLASEVKTHSIEELRGGDFPIFAAGLAADEPFVRAIQFFPAEGPVLVYPEGGNEAVLKNTLNDLLNTTRATVREDVRRAISSREITLSNPYELVQGGRGVVARYAVYHDSGEFMGVVTMVLDLDSVLDIPGLKPAPDGMRVSLTDTGGQVFFGEEISPESEPVSSWVLLPEGRWELAAAPDDEWGARSRAPLAVFGTVGMLISVMGGGLAWMSFSSRARLRRQVAERTAALKLSEERYISAMQVVNEGVWERNMVTGEAYASRSCYTMLGYDKSFSFDSFDEVLALAHPDDAAQVLAEMQRALESGKRFDVVARIRRKDGRWIYLRDRGGVVEWDGDGHPLRMIGTVSDVTEQKEAELHLRESEARFRALFNNNHAPMMLIEPFEGAVLDVNPAACAFYGYSYAELTAMKTSEINTLSEESQRRMRMEASSDRKGPFHFQHRLSNGEIRDVEVFTGPIEQDGKTLLYSIVFDVTARKKVERALEESEMRYRMLLELAPVGIAVHAENRLRYINPFGAKMLGARSPEQLIDRPIYQVIHPDYLAESIDRLQRTLEGETGLYPAENIYVRVDGSSLPVEIVSKLVDFQGESAVLTICTDISARKRAEERVLAAQVELQRLLNEADESRKVLLSVVEDQKLAEEKLNQLNAGLEMRVQERTAQLQAANQELEAFAYSVSHDLRAPLRGIDGWSVALLEDYGEAMDEKAREYLNRVRSETQRMGYLIDDLLRLSRVTRVEMKRSAVNLSVMAEAITARLFEEEPGRDVEISIEPGVTAMGDPHLLEVALTNLLSNAFKFTSKQPQARIEFGVCVTDGAPACYVRDNGAGFDMAYAKNLFGAFQRMHKPAEFPGTGIGLATVQRIIHRHGGRIWADAKKNQGAVFYFTLPEGDGA